MLLNIEVLYKGWCGIYMPKYIYSLSLKDVYKKLLLTVNQLHQLKVLTYFDMILLAKIWDERQKIERKSFMVCMVVVREK